MPIWIPKQQTPKLTYRERSTGEIARETDAYPDEDITDTREPRAGDYSPFPV
jgi:hypothetical protein